MKEVFALIVTYNRVEYLKKLLDKILKINIKGLLIFDNNSSDNTNEELVKMGFANNKLENVLQRGIVNNKTILYYRNDKNTGGAGGFNKGFKLLESVEWDFLWVMDDDVIPDEKCLNNLLKYQTENVQITIPNRTTKEFHENICIRIDLKNPFKIFMKKKKIRSLNDDDVNVNVVDMAFEGPLFNRKIIKKVGLPDKDYFLQFDDTDYATRALKYTNIQLIKDAHLYKQIIPNKSKNRYMNWKDYYAYRNDIIYCRRYGKNIFVKYFTPIFLWFNLTCKAILKMKFKNFKIINKAFIDGYTLKTGKTVLPSKL